MRTTSTLKALCLLACALITYGTVQAQCNLALSVSVTESRCKSTGSITVLVSGGSGNYNYRITGAVPPIVTSTHHITGLPAGVYQIEVKDVADGCTMVQDNIVVPGNYQDPRFQLTATDVSCIGGHDGSITVSGQQYGTGPFTYSIVAPSPSGVGTSNNTGVFTNLVAGNYSVRLTDSCGGIQTRVITIAEYDWWIEAHSVTTNCTNADAVITLKDNKGNTSTSGVQFSGYMYGISAAPGDIVWYPTRSFSFVKGNKRSVTLIAKDACGNIKSVVWNETKRPAIGGTISISNRTCTNVTASVTGQVNLTNPQYCLYTNTGILVRCQLSNPVFNNIPYGIYQMRVTDACYDSTITRNFTVTRTNPSVAGSISVSNENCSTFTATLTGSNLYRPRFCLYDADNNEITCQPTGTFTNLPYGSYCIRVTDTCTGLTLSRCITRNRPVPNVNATVTVTDRGCTSFEAEVTGLSSTANVEYCVYDNDGNLVTCNTTGQFPGLPYGRYCLQIRNDPACFDTTLVRCITVSPSLPSAGSTVNITNTNCTGFSAAISTPVNLTNPQYCLYDNSNNLLACNDAGQFDNLSYGSYCIRIRNDVNCYDTTIERCFTVSQPLPELAASVSITGRICSGFTATMNASNLTNPQFCLFDSVGNQVSCNGTGVFTNVPYGPYCIRVVNTCYDTTMERCFVERPAAMNLAVTASASCTIGATDMSANWTSTVAPFTIRVYNPVNALVYSTSIGSSATAINGLPGLPAGMQYKVVISDDCNGWDSVLITPVASWFNKTISPNSKCPGSIWPNGSGDLQVSATYSEGSVTPKIIRKNGAVVSIGYSTSGGANFIFSDMEPATYVVEYTLQGCSTKQYDTFALQPYSFPDLQQSAVYQCNNNSFTVSAAVNGGLSPFSYEIIGSIPDSPAIVAPPQASAVFSIDNNNTYGLVRLRAIDVCGNATTNDASVLPLANTTISASSDCYYNNITLSVDNIPNATYTWFLKTGETDSVEVGNGQSHNIPYLLPTDTGTYVCKVSVNDDCLTRLSAFHLNGDCDGLLPGNELHFTGSPEGEAVLLQWTTGSGFNARLFVVERSMDGVHYTAIGSVQAGASRYWFTDQQPGSSRNHYRLRVTKAGGVEELSKTVTINRSRTGNWLVYPNPVADRFSIHFPRAGAWSVVLMASDGRRLYNGQVNANGEEVRTLRRPATIKTGTCYLVVTHVATGERRVQALLFK